MDLLLCLCLAQYGRYLQSAYVVCWWFATLVDCTVGFQVVVGRKHQVPVAEGNSGVAAVETATVVVVPGRTQYEDNHQQFDSSVDLGEHCIFHQIRSSIDQRNGDKGRLHLNLGGKWQYRT